MIKREGEEQLASVEELNQQIKILEEASKKLKEAYERRDFEEFNRLKKIIVQTQRALFGERPREDKISMGRMDKSIIQAKRIINEINSLTIAFNRSRNPNERRVISLQIRKLREMLKRVSRESMESTEKVVVPKPLNGEEPPAPNATPEGATSSATTPVLKPKTLSPEQMVQMSIIQQQEQASTIQPTVKVIKKPKPTPLEQLSLKKRKVKQEKDAVKKKEKKPSKYINFANKIFYNFSNSLVRKGNFRELSRNLVKSNMEFVPATYLSVMFLSFLLSIFVAVLIMFFLLFFNVSATMPFITKITDPVGARFAKIFWILIILPAATFLFTYFYPSMEKRSLESRINQELPFAAIHMSSITSSMIEPSKIFKIIIATGEYPHLEKEFIKLQNEINIYGYDLVTALRNRAANSPSRKLAELYNGLTTTITSGGDIPAFFEKRSENLLFEHRLEAEKQSKVAETFMDLYISVVIAAPMIIMLLLMMMRISGFGISLSPFMITLVIILSITMINIMFLTFLHLKQPKD